MDWLTSALDKEFENRFSFLKLLEVTYNKENRHCVITFLYPERVFFNEDNKKIVIDFIKSQLNLYATISVKFKKSYLDDNLIEKAFFEILKNDYPSIYALSDNKSLRIKKEFNNIELEFDVEKDSFEYFDEQKFVNHLKKMLESKFCCDFSITINRVEFEFNTNLEYEREENIFSQKTLRYDVKVIYPIFGGDICPKPEFIKHIKREKTSVILAGKIEKIEKKSYQSKLKRTKGQTRYYYSFDLNDTLAIMDVKYFSSISNEKKMDKLVNGDEVLILGDVKSFNNKLSLYIKAISKCQLPNNLVLPSIFSNDYEVVNPEKHSVLSQDNLFKKTLTYSDEIYQNIYVVFDVETTGLNYETDEIVEIGAAKIQDGKIVSKFVSLIKPTNPIPASATLINGITDLMVAHSPKIDVVIRDFYRFTRGTKMVGYNVPFDQRFIQKAGKEQGLIFDNEFIDVLPLARAKLALTRYKLTDVTKRLEISLEGAHRALADSLATAETFLALNSSNYA